jgi:signal transduction histidine kinase
MTVGAPDPRVGRATNDRRVLRAAVLRFAAMSTIPLAVVAGAVVFASHHVARELALAEASERSQGLAERVVEPYVEDRLRHRDPVAEQRFGRAIQPHIDGGAFDHIILWDEHGTAIWSDDPGWIGHTEPLPDEVKEALATREVLTAAPGDDSLDAPGENDHLDAFYEVYVPGRDDSGESFLLETYIDPRQIAASDAEVFSALLPVGIGGLLLLQLALIPLAYVLARNIERGRRHRAELLERFFDFWQQERLHLAHELHDGVVQDLSGAAYVMPSIVNQLPSGADGDEAKATGVRIGKVLRQNLRAIRSLVFDLVPVELGGNLRDALEALGARQRDAGTEVEINVSEDLVLDPAVATLVYRVVREGLRNVEKHAEAQRVVVTVVERGGMVSTSLLDDGKGIIEHDASRASHFGISLLEALVRDLGGTIELTSRANSGAMLEVVLPARLPL